MSEIPKPDTTVKRTDEQNEWWIVFDTLRQAQKRLEAVERVRHTWIDGALALAKERANV